MAIFEALNCIQGDVFRSSHAYDQPITRTPEDVLECLSDAAWLREIRRLRQLGQITGEQAAQFIEESSNHGAWAVWCDEHGKARDYYISTGDGPD